MDNFTLNLNGLKSELLLLCNIGDQYDIYGVHKKGKLRLCSTNETKNVLLCLHVKDFILEQNDSDKDSDKDSLQFVLHLPPAIINNELIIKRIDDETILSGIYEYGISSTDESYYSMCMDWEGKGFNMYSTSRTIQTDTLKSIIDETTYKNQIKNIKFTVSNNTENIHIDMYYNETMYSSSTLHCVGNNISKPIKHPIMVSVEADDIICLLTDKFLNNKNVCFYFHKNMPLIMITTNNKCTLAVAILQSNDDDDADNDVE
jgi:hypothetical protein